MCLRRLPLQRPALQWLPRVQRAAPLHRAHEHANCSVVCSCAPAPLQYSPNLHPIALLPPSATRSMFAASSGRAREFEELGLAADEQQVAAIASSGRMPLEVLLPDGSSGEGL